MIATIILVASISQAPADANERKPTINGITQEFREKITRETDEIIKNKAWTTMPETPVPQMPHIDLSRSDATGVCFGSIGPWIPWDGNGDISKLDAPSNQPFVRTWTCESRDTIVKALGFTSFFLKGTSFVCSFTPLPQAQIAAKAFDLASFASSGIALVVSVTKCENTLETKFDALLKACDNLRTMGADCRGVDDTPF